MIVNTLKYYIYPGTCLVKLVQKKLVQKKKNGEKIKKKETVNKNGTSSLSPFTEGRKDRWFSPYFLIIQTLPNKQQYIDLCCLMYNM